MFVITVNFKVDATVSEDFREAVINQAANSLNRESDCHRFDVCAAPDDPTRFFLYELYSDRAAFDRHLKSKHFLDFDARTRDWVEEKVVATWTLE